MSSDIEQCCNWLQSQLWRQGDHQRLTETPELSSHKPKPKCPSLLHSALQPRPLPHPNPLHYSLTAFSVGGGGTGLLAVCRNVCHLLRKHWALVPGFFSWKRTHCLCSCNTQPVKPTLCGMWGKRTQVCRGSWFYCPVNNKRRLFLTLESDIICQQI